MELGSFFFVSKFIRPYITKILWLISFVFCMMVDIGIMFYSVLSPSLGMTLRSQNFHVKVKIFALQFIQLYYQDPLMNFLYIWHDGSYRSRVLLSTIPTQSMTLK